MTITLRPERDADADPIRRVTARAFAEAPFSAPPVDDDGAPGEATLVGWLRESPSYDARFARVAVVGDEIVGHVMATWGHVDGVPVLGVGPLSVDAAHQGRGVGTRLMESVMTSAVEAGECVIVLLGDPAYYARFGFVPASMLGIVGEAEWGDFFQACDLTERAGARRGPGAAYPTAVAPRVPKGVYTYAEPFARLG